MINLFIDKARIFVKSGNGGNGAVSFRREKYVPAGGPDGGDGGNGASVIFEVDLGLRTLMDFKYQRKYVAEHGEDGSKKRKAGRNGEDLILKVPPGTIIRDEATGLVIADLKEEGDRAVVAKGGRGGKGNQHFANAVRQAPAFARSGSDGVEKWVVLELKMIADVGLLGFPNVGKSTFLSVVTKAKPKIANYHFTTLTPNLGVVQTKFGESFVLADIPGLIEGAAEGVGLGHDFLRHVERTKVLIHIVDISGLEGRDALDDFDKINGELKLYNEKLATRPQVVVANKMDLPEGQENFERLKEYVEAKGYEICKASAATGEGLRELMFKAYDLLQQYVPEEDEENIARFDEIDPDSYEIVAGEDTEWEVRGKNIERLVAMTNFDNDEALYRFQLIWKRLGIDEALKEKGVQEGESVRIRDMVFEYKDNN